MELVQYLDVPYHTSSPFQTFDVCIPKNLVDNPYDQPNATGLICFIHGGAWRTEDKADHAALAHSLAISTGYPVALPNYRLTPLDPTPDNALYHPAHARDAAQFLEFILSWNKEGGNGCLPRRPSRLFLVGHSCSAHMIGTVLLRMPGDPTDNVFPSNELVQSTAAVIMSEGIYDIDVLLSSFPAYRTWFIEHTFGRRDTFENVSVLKATINPDARHIRWFIIHSKGDTQVDERQSQGMYDFLKENSCLVYKSFDDLEDDHDDILKSPLYVNLISRHVKRVVGAGPD